MPIRVVAMSAVIVLLTISSVVRAQKTTQVHPGEAGSPHVRTEWTIDGARISIEYGRPYLKGRAPGKDIDPFEGQEWRTGADEATTLKTDKPLRFGSLSLRPGTYTLYTIPVSGQWQLIVSRKTGQWGIPYPAGSDLGRVPMTMAILDKPAEQLTISIDNTPAGATLRIEWGEASAMIPFLIG